MSDTWSPGDLALCIDDKWYALKDPTLPRLGIIYQVDRTFYGPTMIGLGFPGWPALLFNSRCFTKVKPDTAPGDDAEIIALITGADRKVAA